jgi:hypothetical protein
MHLQRTSASAVVGSGTQRRITLATRTTTCDQLHLLPVEVMVSGAEASLLLLLSCQHVPLAHAKLHVLLLTCQEARLSIQICLLLLQHHFALSKGTCHDLQKNAAKSGTLIGLKLCSASPAACQ